MPALDINFFKKEVKNFNDNLLSNYTTFDETGTYMGKTIFNLEPYFNKLYTIEIKEQFYKRAKNLYNGNKINFILGDSSEQLISLCEKLETSTIFFLDGHWSSGNTGRGKKDCPLYEELGAIINSFKHNAIIIIDDVRLFGKGPNIGNEKCNWEDINYNKVLLIANMRLENHYFKTSFYDKNNRLILHINKI